MENERGQQAMMQHDALDQALMLRRSISASRRLMLSQVVDLSGIEDEIGRLCAVLLDLPAEEAAPLNKAMTSLLATVDVLVEEWGSEYETDIADATD